MYAVNDTQQDLVVLLKNDLVSEQTESFFVDLSSPIGTPCDTAIVLIQGDDQPPSMSLTHSILIEHKLKKYYPSLPFVPFFGTYWLSLTTLRYIVSSLSWHAK